MNTIVIAALALLILVILILVFRSQIGKTSQSYIDIGEQASKEAGGANKCQSLLSSNACYPGPNCPSKYVLIPEPAKKWSDCGKGEVCCKPLG